MRKESKVVSPGDVAVNRIARIWAIFAILVLVFSSSGCFLFGPKGAALHWIDGWDVNDPTWLDNSTILATIGGSNQFITISYPDFAVTNSYSFPSFPDHVIHLPDVSPDRTMVTVHGRVGIFSDIFLFTFAGAVELPITPVGTSEFHSPTFLDNTNLRFYEYRWGAQVDQFLVESTIPPGAPTTHVPGTVTNPSNFSGSFPDRFVEDDSYWWPQINSVGTRYLLCKMDYSVSRPTFAVLDGTGIETHNGLGILNMTKIAGGDWIDADTFIITVGIQEDYSLAVVDVAGAQPVLVDIIYLDNEAIRQAYGVRVSPDGTKAVLHVWAEDDDRSGNALVVVELN